MRSQVLELLTAWETEDFMPADYSSELAAVATTERGPVRREDTNSRTAIEPMQVVQMALETHQPGEAMRRSFDLLIRGDSPDAVLDVIEDMRRWRHRLPAHPGCARLGGLHRHAGHRRRRSLDLHRTGRAGRLCRRRPPGLFPPGVTHPKGFHPGDVLISTGAGDRGAYRGQRPRSTVWA